MEFAETLKALAKPVTDAASGAADSAEAAYLNSTLLNEVVDEFRTICETSYANLYTPAMGVCFSLLMIEFATDWTLSPEELGYKEPLEYSGTKYQYAGEPITVNSL